MSKKAVASIKPWVAQDTFIGILWGGEAVGSLFIFLRLFIRYRAFSKFWSDDYIIMITWLCSLSICVLWQINANNLYNQYKMSNGELQLTADTIQHEMVLLRGSAAFLMLWHICIYGIKAAFLIFFGRLDQLHDGPRKKWRWFVSVFTICSGMTSIGVTDWQCLLSRLAYVLTQCANPQQLRFQHLGFIVSCVLDVISDALIISIPVTMLWNVRVHLGKKLALMSLFSLTIIVMMTAVARVAVNPTKHIQADPSWLYLWYNIELFVAMLVSSLASFRQLYITQSSRTKQNSDQRTRSTNSNIIFMERFWIRPSLSPLSGSNRKPSASGNGTLPLSSVDVAHDANTTPITPKPST
ncbi:unnamed protein product [Periconia digitata]|uniref:Rhodopsin domain-containing protein n=1 Tax=Periconia digitata TaxID=1303443 RepID=A0A9W4U6B6_9PLEO|nr:unnamed protein product [Periconia digitata]